jgi:hypothetical protein
VCLAQDSLAVGQGAAHTAEPADALPPPPGAEADLAALQAEEKSLLELLNEQARLHARRVLTGE